MRIDICLFICNRFKLFSQKKTKEQPRKNEEIFEEKKEPKAAPVVLKSSEVIIFRVHFIKI